MSDGSAEADCGVGPFAQHSVATVEFLLRLRSRGIRNLDVLRAIEQVPRGSFVPHRYADLALRDIALPIGCGQTMPDAFALARMVETLALNPKHRVLEIGTGSGYATAVIAKLAGEVLSLERFQSLATAARTRLASSKVGNAEVVWGDGLQLPAQVGSFDRIFVEAEVDEIPQAWRAALAREGLVVRAKAASDGTPHQHVVRTVYDPAGQSLETTVIPVRLQPLLPGLARAL